MRDRVSSAFVWMAMAGVLAAAVPGSALSAAPHKVAAKTPAKAVKSTAVPIGDEAAQMIGWIVANKDNGQLPFAVVDKFNAEVFVFDAEGKLQGQSPALVGYASGDDSTPGIGDREMSDIKPSERTTPAGRFQAWYGPGPHREKVLWVDYDTAISMHAVVTAHPEEKRLARLATPSAADNHITYGCINLPAAFYAQYVEKAFSAKGGVVYVLPDTKTLAQVFPMRQMQASAAPHPVFGPEEPVATKVSAPGGRVAAR